MNVVRVANSLEASIFPEVYKRKLEEWQKEDSSNLLPNSFPLSRRFADYKWREFGNTHKKDKRFMNGAYPIDKFKDIVPCLTLKIHSNHVSFESSLMSSMALAGDTSANEGILLYDLLALGSVMSPSVYPQSNEFIEYFLKECLDDQVIPADLVDLLDEMQCMFYDGCIVVEVQDHRKALTKSSANQKQISPETKRILLKPSYKSILNDISVMKSSHNWNEEFELEVEKGILLATSAPICLNPSPTVTKLFNYYHYNKNKFKILSDGLHSVEEQRKVCQHQKSSKTFAPRFELLNMIEEIRRNKSLIDSEPLLGLDKKGNVSKSSWNVPLQKIYRTLRFEKESSDGARTFMSLNVIAVQSNLYEIVLRIGVAPDTSLKGSTTRFFMKNLIMVDNYIQNLKFLFSLQDQSIRCVADVTNSTLAQSIMPKTMVKVLQTGASGSPGNIVISKQKPRPNIAMTVNDSQAGMKQRKIGGEGTLFSNVAPPSQMTTQMASYQQTQQQMQSQLHKYYYNNSQYSSASQASPKMQQSTTNQAQQPMNPALHSALQQQQYLIMQMKKRQQQQQRPP